MPPPSPKDQGRWRWKRQSSNLHSASHSSLLACLCFFFPCISLLASFLYLHSSPSSFPSSYYASLAFSHFPCTPSWLPAGEDGRGDKGWGGGDLRDLGSAWNSLEFGRPPLVPSARLRIALFVKKWPVAGMAGGLERHAATLHRALALRGHSVHVFTVSSLLPGASPAATQQEEEEVEEESGLRLYFSRPNPSGNLDLARSWNQFAKASKLHPFDIIHSESVALPHYRARDLPNVAVSWHGISFETLHSDIVADVLRTPDTPRPTIPLDRIARVADEIKFFPSYRHHVATSDSVGEILESIYQIPPRNVHIILNGVDTTKFYPDPLKGAEFRTRHNIPLDANLVLGVSGRLVKDKGHPILVKAMKQILSKHSNIYLLVAGNGPWGHYYQELGPKVKSLGPLDPSQLNGFYNSLDVFLNPTLRAQGLDHTLLEAMLCGKPLMATRFPSITRSVIIGEEFGYTFHPNTASLIGALKTAFAESKEALQRKGRSCFRRASWLFTADKMASSYERLFLCMANSTFCQYPMEFDPK